jgi:exopolyphosphatase
MSIEQLNQVLRYEKENVTHLSTRDLLRRDYKQYVWENSSTPINGGLSTVPLSLKGWLEKDPPKSYLRSLDAWAKERKLDVVGVLNTYKSKKKGHHRREILVYVTGNGVGVKDKIWKGLQEDKDLELERITLPDVTDAQDNSSNIRAWDQGNTKATRKIIAPAFERIFKL